VRSLRPIVVRIQLIPYQDALRRINVVRRDLRTGPIVFNEVRGNSNFNFGIRLKSGQTLFGSIQWLSASSR